MSSANDIQGRNCIFQMKIDDDYQDVLCAKTFSLNRTYELKETTTKQSGFDKEFRPRRKSYTISFNGVVQTVADANKPTIKTLFDNGEDFLPIPYRIIYEDNSGNVMVITGQVYLTSAVFSANPINLLDGTIEMQGNGPIEISDVVPDLANINIVSLGDNSILATFQFKLFDSTGAIVFDSGQLPSASGGNLTHPVSVTGTVQKGTYSIFWQADAQSAGNAFQLDAPPTKSEIFNNVLTNESTYGIQEYDFTANRTVTFTLGVPVPPPVCVPPAFLTGLNNPTATVGTPWTGTVTISGSQPFSISNITKPAWMSISLSGNTVTLSGNPESGIDQAIIFDITNTCGTATYNDSIDVSSNPDGITLTWNYTESGILAGASAMRVYVNATLMALVLTPGSNAAIINAGDFVEIQIVGVSGVNKHIDVQASVAGEIINANSTGVILTRTFTAVLGNDYVINGSAT